MLSAIIAIIGGIIAASSFIIAKKPDAKELIDKLTPYQGWIGVVLTFFGVWGIFNSLVPLQYKYAVIIIFLIFVIMLKHLIQ